MRRELTPVASLLLLPQSSYRHWQQGLPADLTKPCVVAQWYDSPVLGGTLYAYGKNYSDTSNMSAIAGGWKEVDCVATKAVYFCRSVSECLRWYWTLCYTFPGCRFQKQTSLAPTHCLPSCAAPGVSEYYKTPVSNLTYYLNTSYVNWQEGETMCKRNGGHLAAYNSSAEQVRLGPEPRARAVDSVQHLQLDHVMKFRLAATRSMWPLAA
jgi:hypothetical protein